MMTVGLPLTKYKYRYFSVKMWGVINLVRSLNSFFRDSKHNTIRFIPIILAVLLLFSMLPTPEVGAIGETISVFRPVDDQEVVAGSQLRVQWSISGPGRNVKVYLSTDGGNSFNAIADVRNTPSHGMGWYDWTVPPNIDSTTCKIRVIWRDNLNKPYTILQRTRWTGTSPSNPVSH